MVSVSATPAAGTITPAEELARVEELGLLNDGEGRGLPVARRVGRSNLYVQGYPFRSQPGLLRRVVSVVPKPNPAPNLRGTERPPVELGEVTLEPAATAAKSAAKPKPKPKPAAKPVAEELALNINQAVAESAEAEERAEAESAEDRRQRAKAKRAKNKKQKAKEAVNPAIKLTGVQLTEEPKAVAAKWLEAQVVEVERADATEDLSISITSLGNAKQIVDSVLVDEKEKKIIIERFNTHLWFIKQAMKGVKRFRSVKRLVGSTAPDVINKSGIEKIRLFAEEVKIKAKTLKKIKRNRTAIFNNINPNQAFKEEYGSLMKLLDDTSQYEEFDIKNTAAEAVRAGKERKEVGKRALDGDKGSESEKLKREAIFEEIAIRNEKIKEEAKQQGAYRLIRVKSALSLKFDSVFKEAVNRLDLKEVFQIFARYYPSQRGEIIKQIDNLYQVYLDKNRGVTHSGGAFKTQLNKAISQVVSAINKNPDKEEDSTPVKRFLLVFFGNIKPKFAKTYLKNETLDVLIEELTQDDLRV